MAPILSNVLDLFLSQIGLAVPKELVRLATDGFGDWVKELSAQYSKIMGGEGWRLAFLNPPIVPDFQGWTPDLMLSGASAMEAQERDLLYQPIGILGQVKGFLDLGAAGPIQAMVRQFDYQTRNRWPLWLPDAGTIVAAAIKTEDGTGYNRALRLQGLDLWSHRALEDAAREHLSPVDYWRLWRLGTISKEDYEGKYLSQAGLFKGDRPRIDDLNMRRPGIQELWTARRRGFLSKEKFADGIWRVGYDKDNVDFWDQVLRVDMPLEALTRGFWYGIIGTQDYLKGLIDLGFRDEDTAMMLAVVQQTPDLSALLSLWRREIIDDEGLTRGLKRHGFTDQTAKDMRELRYETPDPETAITWRRRGLIGDDELGSLFKAAGLRLGHAEKMGKLVHIIPPVQDLVRMAVREAFTPAAIEKFQLHQEFPDDFRAWAEKQGLSEFWAKAYWASHWELPGIREVFDIFHRIDRTTHQPLIDAATVDEFLKVADISPFWRPLIRQISYEPYTRVDVRRMYKMEVVDEQEVYDTYRDLGYNETKARALTDWTKKEYAPEKTELTKADILDAYRKGILKRAEAKTYLTDIGILANDITFYLARTEYQIEGDRKEATLASMKAMYIADIVSLDAVVQRLRDDNYEELEIQRLTHLWILAKAEEKAKKTPGGAIPKTVRPSVSELSAMLRKNVIDELIFMQELTDLGYSEKYVGWFLKSALA